MAAAGGGGGGSAGGSEGGGHAAGGGAAAAAAGGVARAAARAAAEAPAVKALRIKTAAVVRLEKELLRYTEEQVTQRAKIESMTAAGADEYDIKKQVRRP